MYIIYNNDGSIKKINLTDYIQKGNDNVNSIFLGIEGRTNAQWAATVYFTLPTGDTVDPEIITPITASQTIDGVTYSGWNVSIPAAVTAYEGIVTFSVSISDLNDNVLFTYQGKLVINPSSVVPNETKITVAQYQALLNLVNQKLAPTSTPNVVYGTNGDGEQVLVGYGENVNGGDLVKRDEGGQVIVPTEPQNSGDATSKTYVDSKSFKGVITVTVGAHAIITTGSITSSGTYLLNNNKGLVVARSTGSTSYQLAGIYGGQLFQGEMKSNSNFDIDENYIIKFNGRIQLSKDSNYNYKFYIPHANLPYSGKYELYGENVYQGVATVVYKGASGSNPESWDILAFIDGNIYHCTVSGDTGDAVFSATHLYLEANPEITNAVTNLESIRINASKYQIKAFKGDITINEDDDPIITSAVIVTLQKGFYRLLNSSNIVVGILFVYDRSTLYRKFWGFYEKYYFESPEPNGQSISQDYDFYDYETPLKVDANPTLDGTEIILNGLVVGPNKYRIRDGFEGRIEVSLDAYLRPYIAYANFSSLAEGTYKLVREISGVSHIVGLVSVAKVSTNTYFGGFYEQKAFQGNVTGNNDFTIWEHYVDKNSFKGKITVDDLNGRIEPNNVTSGGTYLLGDSLGIIQIKSLGSHNYDVAGIYKGDFFKGTLNSEQNFYFDDNKYGGKKLYKHVFDFSTQSYSGNGKCRTMAFHFISNDPTPLSLTGQWTLRVGRDILCLEDDNGVLGSMIIFDDYGGGTLAILDYAGDNVDFEQIGNFDDSVSEY